MAPEAVSISFRLGGNDGVSVEARKWARALRALGFETRRLAGAFEDGGEPDDVELPALAIGATEPVDHAELTHAIEGADLVVVENVCSLPLNVNGARAVADAAVAHGGRIVFRHHDLPWQRRNLRHLEDEYPPRVPSALHATVNLRSRRELEARGYVGVEAIHNCFDFDAPTGDRASTRTGRGFTADQLVVLQPARAIERKNVPGGIRFAARLSKLLPEQRVQYWLSGPAEDGYAPTLERIIERSPVPITVGRAATAADAYAAGDVVVLPSTWEGFGNPTIESIVARRPCAAFPYPVLAEILASGVRLFSTEHPETVAHFLCEPPELREHYFDTNVHRARLSFDLAELPSAIERAFRDHGWTSW